MPRSRALVVYVRDIFPIPKTSERTLLWLTILFCRSRYLLEGRHVRSTRFYRPGRGPEDQTAITASDWLQSFDTFGSWDRSMMDCGRRSSVRPRGASKTVGSSPFHTR